MTLSRRSLLTIGGGLAAAATLAACGSNTGRSPSPSASASDAAPTAKLSQWYHQYGEDGVEAAVKKWAAEFTGAQVQVNWVTANYNTAIAAALLTPTAPDVFESENGPTLDMIKAGQVADLTEVVGSARAEFTPSVLNRFVYQDKIWGIPQTVDMHCLYYRPSLLAKAGIQPPQTFDELRAAAKALRTKDLGGFYAGKDGGLGVLGNMLIWASGSDQLNADQTAAGFTNADFYAGVTKYREFFNSGDLLKSGSGEWYEPDTFTNEETAMQWAGLWDMPKIAAALGDDFGVIPFPAVGANGRKVAPFGAFTACVNAKSQNVDAAKAFVKWLWVDGNEKQVEFSNAFGTHIPAKPALFPQATKVANGPGADAARMVTDFGHTSGLFWTPACSEAFSTALSNVVLKKADPASEFTKAGDKIQTELKRVKG